MGTPTASAMSGRIHSVFVYGSFTGRRRRSCSSQTSPSVFLCHSQQLVCPFQFDFYFKFISCLINCGVDDCSHRFSIKGRVYPAILPLENHKVTGRVSWTPPLQSVHISFLFKMMKIHITGVAGNHGSWIGHFRCIRRCWVRKDLCCCLFDGKITIFLCLFSNLISKILLSIKANLIHVGHSWRLLTGSGLRMGQQKRS